MPAWVPDPSFSRGGTPRKRGVTPSGCSGTEPGTSKGVLGIGAPPFARVRSASPAFPALSGLRPAGAGPLPLASLRSAPRLLGRPRPCRRPACARRSGAPSPPVGVAAAPPRRSAAAVARRLAFGPRRPWACAAARRRCAAGFLRSPWLRSGLPLRFAPAPGPLLAPGGLGPVSAAIRRLAPVVAAAAAAVRPCPPSSRPGAWPAGAGLFRPAPGRRTKSRSRAVAAPVAPLLRSAAWGRGGLWPCRVGVGAPLFLARSTRTDTIEGG